jgi:hypothetical protein
MDLRHHAQSSLSSGPSSIHPPRTAVRLRIIPHLQLARVPVRPLWRHSAHLLLPLVPDPSLPHLHLLTGPRRDCYGWLGCSDRGLTAARGRWLRATSGRPPLPSGNLGRPTANRGTSDPLPGGLSVLRGWSVGICPGSRPTPIRDAMGRDSAKGSVRGGLSSCGASPLERRLAGGDTTRNGGTVVGAGRRKPGSPVPIPFRQRTCADAGPIPDAHDRRPRPTGEAPPPIYLRET